MLKGFLDVASRERVRAGFRCGLSGKTLTVRVCVNGEERLRGDASAIRESRSVDVAFLDTLLPLVSSSSAVANDRMIHWTWDGHNAVDE